MVSSCWMVFWHWRSTSSHSSKKKNQVSLPASVLVSLVCTSCSRCESLSQERSEHSAEAEAILKSLLLFSFLPASPSYRLRRSRQRPQTVVHKWTFQTPRNAALFSHSHSPAAAGEQRRRHLAGMCSERQRESISPCLRHPCSYLYYFLGCMVAPCSLCSVCRAAQTWTSTPVPPVTLVIRLVNPVRASSFLLY